MKLHIITIGSPKLDYAKIGWQEYFGRLSHYHQLRTTHIPDKKAGDSDYILESAGNAYKVTLVIDGQQLSSPELAEFLEKRAIEAKEVCLMIGGPEGLPAEIIQSANFCLSLSKLTLPHDLAMIVLLEALYRASTINAGSPYHK